MRLGDALFVHLYLADMACFGAANAAYTRHFPAVSPPARACVQALLPPGRHVAVDVLLANGEAMQGPQPPPASSLYRVPPRPKRTSGDGRAFMRGPAAVAEHAPVEA